MDKRKDLRRIYEAGIRAVNARQAVLNCLEIADGHLEIRSKGRPFRRFNLDNLDHIYVVGAGKAGAAMAGACETILGDRITAGAVCVKYGHGEDLNRVRVFEAAHPVPDENGLTGAGAILDLVRGAGENDLILSLISGGGSALIPLPANGISLAEKQEVTRRLLECGADIREINCIRKHMSRIKGGQMARAAWPAFVVNLIISDVVGDPLDAIASGPLTGDPSTFGQALDILSSYGLAEQIPVAVRAHLEAGSAGAFPDTPLPGDDLFQKVGNLICAANITALEAARAAAAELGYQALILSSAIEGDTARAARFHAAIAREVLASGHPCPAPACIISGGETTVLLTGTGKGGRNMEFALQASRLIQGDARILVAGIGTDGTDGPTDAAGAMADGTSLDRAAALGMDYSAIAANNDSYPFFKALGDLIVTGPTRTNVMDLRIMLIA